MRSSVLYSTNSLYTYTYLHASFGNGGDGFFGVGSSADGGGCLVGIGGCGMPIHFDAVGSTGGALAVGRAGGGLKPAGRGFGSCWLIWALVATEATGAGGGRSRALTNGSGGGGGLQPAGRGGGSLAGGGPGSSSRSFALGGNLFALVPGVLGVWWEGRTSG